MRVHIGGDHAAYDLQQHLLSFLAEQGHEVINHGPDTYDAADDYPVYVLRAAEAVAADPGSLGIVLGGSGNGEQMAANKVIGVRSALVWSEETAVLAREHNDANVLSMGGRIVAPALADEIVVCFLQTPYQGGRHQRRVDQLDELGRLGADGQALDAYLDSLVPGIAGRTAPGDAR